VRKRVLLADGDCGLLSIRSLRLRIEGYEVEEVGDSGGVVRALEWFAPDLLLLDPAIPGGEPLLREIRGQRRYQALKVVINSARDFGSAPSFCRELGADAFLTKPVDHDGLLGTLRKLLPAAASRATAA
jgi:DNA-binding response OmpR family regulator